MALQIDKYLQALTIDEEEETPLIISNLPNFSSTEINSKSILGRFLNPDNQRMSRWILDMPRVWRLYDRVHGIALSRDRFQFIFKYEEDLLEILKTGVWTQDDWGVVMERWIEDPPPNYLMFLPIWIRLRNIPVNHYTRDTIKQIASRVGEVIEFPFDEDEAQSCDFLRLRVLFDVTKGLKNSTEIQLPNGSVIKIGIDYERIRKRCFLCQRLTHDKTRCPYNQQPLPRSVDVDLPAPSKQIDKGNAVVYREEAGNVTVSPPPKLMADALKSNAFQDLSSIPDHFITATAKSGTFLPGSSSAFTVGSLEASSSSSFDNRVSSCKRPRSWTKNTKTRMGKTLKTKDGSVNIKSSSEGKKISLQKGKGLSTPVNVDNHSVVPGERPQDQ